MLLPKTFSLAEVKSDLDLPCLEYDIAKVLNKSSYHAQEGEAASRVAGTVHLRTSVWNWLGADE